MRRIYESEALDADDEDPFKPNRAADRSRGRSHVDWANASHALMPTALRRRALSVEVETDRDVYTPDDPVHFRVVFRNRLPVPVTIRTATPVRWSWSLDGLERASRVERAVPETPGVFRFGRGERKVFTRRWIQRIRESEREWSPAASGDHAIRVWVNDDSTAAESLAAETAFRIE
ncbi:MAG: hypothetical protein ACQETI_08635 [Halobacteriota archaeon]